MKLLEGSSSYAIKNIVTGSRAKLREERILRRTLQVLGKYSGSEDPEIPVTTVVERAASNQKRVKSSSTVM